jgi:hypothetical protein
MDPHSCQRERLDVAAHQRSFDCGGHTAGGDDYLEVEGVPALAGHPAKIWYVVRIPAFICAELSLAYAHATERS